MIAGTLGFLIAGLLSLLGFIFWVWMLIDAITNKRLRDVEKLIWVLVVIFLPLIGSIIYFFVARSQRAGG